jgi:hypothetical protein
MFEHNRAHREQGRRTLGFLVRWNLSLNKITEDAQKRQRRSGQVVVEYVLLLVIAVGIAGLVLRGCVSRNENQAGVVIQLWDQMLKFIGSDIPDEP